MPRRDGSGPEGRGPMTGRGMGGCGGSGSSADTARPMQGGIGRRPANRGGRGLGRRIASGFNNLRMRARGRKQQTGAGRGRNRQ